RTRALRRRVLRTAGPGREAARTAGDPRARRNPDRDRRRLARRSRSAATLRMRRRRERQARQDGWFARSARDDSYRARDGHEGHARMHGRERRLRDGGRTHFAARRLGRYRRSFPHRARPVRGRYLRSREADSAGRTGPRRSRSRHGVSKRRYAILAIDRFAIDAKTAHGVIRYGEDDVVAVVDPACAGRRAGDVLPHLSSDAPVVATIEESLAYAPTSLLIGTAPRGGALPPEWRRAVLDAIAARLEIVSGLHDMLGDDREFRTAAM